MLNDRTGRNHAYQAQMRDAYLWIRLGLYWPGNISFANLKKGRGSCRK